MSNIDELLARHRSPDPEISAAAALDITRLIEVALRETAIKVLAILKRNERAERRKREGGG